MAKNVTLRLDDDILIKCRHAAVDEKKSLSKWLSDLVKKELNLQQQYLEASIEAAQALKKGLSLHNNQLKRDEIYDR